jgi:excisionase family DNA binding protein
MAGAVAAAQVLSTLLPLSAGVAVRGELFSLGGWPPLVPRPRRLQRSSPSANVPYAALVAQAASGEDCCSGDGVTDRLLTAREIADLLGVSAETVLRWTRRGELSAFRLPGGALRYRADVLERWLGEHATTGPADREVLTTRASRARRDGAYATLESASLTTPPGRPATTEEDT